MQINLHKLSYFKTGIDETEFSKKALARRDILKNYAQMVSEGCSQRTALKVLKISRSTYYRWKSNYYRYGFSGLEEESRRPRKVRQRCWNNDLAKLVLQLRKTYPVWGKDKIAVMVNRRTNKNISVSTVGRIIKMYVERGAILPVDFYYGKTGKKKPRKFNGHAQRWKYGMKSNEAGELIQVDHMSVESGSGKTIKHFKAVCPTTKMAAEQVYSDATALSAAQFLDYMINEFPFPIISIQVDGGSEFRSEFEALCKERGIPLFVLPPKRPQYNGTVERSNSTARYEFYSIYTGSFKITPLRKAIKQFNRLYNRVRPHQSLQYLTPWQYYTSMGVS